MHFTHYRWSDKLLLYISDHRAITVATYIIKLFWLQKVSHSICAVCVCVSHVFLCVSFTKLECHLISKRFYCNIKMGWTTRMNFSQHYKMCTCMYLRIFQKVVVTALAQNTRTHTHLVLIMIFMRLSPYTLLIIRIQSCAFIIMVCTCAGLKMQYSLRHAPHSTDTSQIPHTCNAKWNVSVWDADDIGRQTCRNNALNLKKWIEDEK